MFLDLIVLPESGVQCFGSGLHELGLCMYLYEIKYVCVYIQKINIESKRGTERPKWSPIAF